MSKKQTFKKYTSLALLVCIVFATLSLSSCFGRARSGNPERRDIPTEGTSIGDLMSEDFVEIARNDNLALYFNHYTTDIRLQNLRTGFVWSSDFYDSNLEEYIRGEVFILRHTDRTGAEHFLSSADESVERGQFEITELEDGVRIFYGVGEIAATIFFPLALSEERFEALGQRIEDELGIDYRFDFEGRYELQDFTDQDELALMNEFDLEQARQNFPMAFDAPWHYIRAGWRNTEDVNSLNRMMDAIGYTESELDDDNRGINVSELMTAEFSVAVEFRLTDDALSVTLPGEYIYFTDDFTLESIQLLPNFSNFDENTEGYFLLPDGSGSIMHFNNGRARLREGSVYVQMYGVDNSRVTTYRAAVYNDAIFPIFGTTVKGQVGTQNSEEDFNGIFGVIESGDTFAGISADTSDPETFRNNRMFVDFRVNELVQMEAFGGGGDHATYRRYQFQRYLGDLKVNYHVLDGFDATYSGMANFYRDMLFGDEEPLQARDHYATIDILGLINTTGRFLGITYNSREVLTSFNDVRTIAESLKENGFNNFNVRIKGWTNHGYSHGYLNRLRVANQMGGEDDLLQLVEDLEGQGIGVFPDVDFQNVYIAETSPRRREGAAMLNGGLSVIPTWNPLFFTPMPGLAKAALTMPAAESNLNDFLRQYERLGINNLSLRSLGSEITSNFRDDDSFMERQETLGELTRMARGVSENKRLMGTGGQAPFLPYLDIINQMPIVSSGFDKSDYSVPFTAMVLSGHREFTYRHINLSHNNRRDLLGLIESGAGLSYVLTYNFYRDIGLTAYGDFNSTVFNDVRDNVFETFSFVEEALRGVFGSRIARHDRVAYNVTRTIYENGTAIFVNYSAEDFAGEGFVVPAQNFYRVDNYAERGAN